MKDDPGNDTISPQRFETPFAAGCAQVADLEKQIAALKREINRHVRGDTIESDYLGYPEAEPEGEARDSLRRPPPKFERILCSGIIVDGVDPGADPRMSIADLAHSLANVNRWGGHSPQPVTVAQHCIAMARRARELRMSGLDQFACLHHEDAEIILGDAATLLKAQPQMAWFAWLETRIRDSLIKRFAPALIGYDWSRIKPLDRAALRVESEGFPRTADRDAHKPFSAQTMGLLPSHYPSTDPTTVKRLWRNSHFDLRTKAGE